MMRRWLAPAVLTAAAAFAGAPQSAAAQSAGETASSDVFGRPCAITGGVDSCAPFFGCIDVEGGAPLFFFGRADGWGEGPLEARLANGAQCEGVWRQTPTGGEAQASCDDGRSYASALRYQDRPTGTAISEGLTNRGEAVIVWSGLNVPEYLRDYDDAPDWARACGLEGLTS